MTHEEFEARLKQTHFTTEQAHDALQKLINGTHSLHVPPMIDDPDMLIGRVIEERDELMAENQTLNGKLQQVVSVGHNENCMFCGMKDRIALQPKEDMK